MQSGRLRHRLKIQAKSESRDTDGNVTITFSDLATVWGQVTPLRGSKTVSLERVQDNAQFTVRLRFYAGLTPSHRLLFGTRVLEILAVVNPEERNREMVLSAVEV